MTIVILRTGDAIPEVAPRRGEFSRWIREAVGLEWGGDWVEHDVRGDAAMPALDGASAFVVTGSVHSVTERAPWMLRTEAYLRAIHGAGVPLFGICFGHQLIGQALGGEVQRNPYGREMGTVRVRARAAHPMFDGLGDDFDVNATHVDSVVRLPHGARVIGVTALEPHAAFAVGDTTWGVQFHPEIDGDLMRGYVKARAAVLEREGFCAESMHDAVHDAPDGPRILKNFVKQVVARRIPLRAA